MARAFREMMCKENINAIHNSGALIPEGKAFRLIVGVMGNSTAATALTDEEIVELSKYNEDACMTGRSEYDHYYQIKFVGEFSLNTRCYSIIRPCMCVLDYEDGMTSIMTARFSVMNSITRLITRVKQDTVKYAIVYRIENDGRKEKIKTFTDMDQLVLFIQSDKKGSELEKSESEVINTETNENTDIQMNINSEKETELLSRIKQLEEELSRKEEYACRIEKEFGQIKEENIKLKTMIDMIRNIIG